jgi:hypothetical protein
MLGPWSEGDQLPIMPLLAPRVSSLPIVDGEPLQSGCHRPGAAETTEIRVDR